MFEPWRGPTYGHSNNALGGMRLIVLGEAHYLDAPIGTSTPSFTKSVVEGYIKGEHSHRFFTRVMNIMLDGTGSARERRQAFWDSVVFFQLHPFRCGQPRAAKATARNVGRGSAGKFPSAHT